MPVPRLSNEGDDPLSIFMKPPPYETDEERTDRLRREAEEKRVSDQIDEYIKAERAAMKKKRSDIKLLLLGQSESGKSTTLKNFQLTFAPKAWREERTSWRAVIQFNLVRSVNTILDVLSKEMLSALGGGSTAHLNIAQSSSRPPSGSWSMDALDANLDGNFSSDDEQEVYQPIPASTFPPLKFTSSHSLLKLRLAPLRSVECDLKTFLGAGSTEVTASTSDISQMVATPFDIDYRGSAPPSASLTRRRTNEFAVRSHAAWKRSLGMHTGSSKTRPSSPKAGLDLDGATEVIAGCKDDIKMLWHDPLIQELLKRRGVKLGDSAAYYFHHVDRIANRKYEPSDDDVLRARLRTLGVQEHKLVFEHSADEGRSRLPTTDLDLLPSADAGSTWCIYDVGGSRTSVSFVHLGFVCVSPYTLQRAAWLPFFDDAHAILFLAPINCFDEQLAEDPRVNRLQDSMILWKSIVSSKLLTGCSIVLFLNKYDLLVKKLQSGVQARDFVTNYGDRENDAAVFAKYMRGKFKTLLKDLSPKPRPFYGFLTSVIDQQNTGLTLSYLRDGILREHLKKAEIV
ncbi:unnamed protein product [Somion occarium]|uniref:Guanine nucleotide-binding protein alpha-4 subunit n=1 Tax=Somion occarium TaxID=3059160 RepID=A0ABP1DP06_9APHY